MTATAIRPATIHDATGIAHVQVASWKSTYRGIVPDTFLNALTIEKQTEMWQSHLSAKTSLIFIAEDAGNLFGFISGGPIREACKAYDAELYAIYLLPARQRQGTGRRLTSTFIAALQQSQYTSMLVWVLEANPCLPFYKKLGGKEELRKTITIAEKELPELAFGWPDLTTSFDNAPSS